MACGAAVLPGGDFSVKRAPVTAEVYFCAGTCIDPVTVLGGCSQGGGISDDVANMINRPHGMQGCG
jgi:hypothetical protein